MTPETATAIGDAFVKVLDRTKGDYKEVRIAVFEALGKAFAAPANILPRNVDPE